jgi:ribosomal protein L5
MPNNKKNITNFPNLIRFKETHYYEQALHSVSLFPYNNNHLSPNFFKIILNFSLKEVAFNKKKALPFFLAMELLSNQKCVATLSSKNIMV